MVWPTPYAEERGAFSFSGSSWWWLRSSVSNRHSAAIVGGNGQINSYGGNVDNVEIAIRVALVIDLEIYEPPTTNGGSSIMSEEVLKQEYSNKENSQKIDLLALRSGFHKDRTRLVFDLSDSCVWEETPFTKSFLIQITGAASKIDDNLVKLGHEVEEVEISSIGGRTSIRIGKGNTGGYVQVQLVDALSYKLVVDVFKLKKGQTQKEQFENYLAGKIDIPDNAENLDESNIDNNEQESK